MKVSATQLPVCENDADAVVVGVYQDEPIGGPVTEIDEATNGAVKRLLESQEFRGKPNELLPLFCASGVATRQILLVGLGEKPTIDRGRAFRAAATASRHLADRKRDRVGFYFDTDWSAATIENAIIGAVSGCAGQDLYRAEKKVHPFDEILWAGQDSSPLASGLVLGESVNLARRLVDEPPHAMYPETFAKAASDVAEATGMQIEIWDQARLEQEGCGAILAVARGSARPARLVIMRHNGGVPGNLELALVGKGVTFDSGGLSLKPTDGMKTMKCDMAGAATVLGAMYAIAKLRLPVSVIGLMGLVENMVDGSSYKLGDVVTARSGKTIEIHNTDAEGRLVLADVLSVAIERGPARIIDLATLTGACVVALGLDVAGLMTNDQSWCDQVAAAANACGEPAWQLPMFSEFGEQIKSDVADIKNVGEGRWGGAITAAKFLEEFVDGTPWTHIDIAGPAFRDKAKPWSDSGGTGAFVLTLVEIARQLQSANA